MRSKFMGAYFGFFIHILSYLQNKSYIYVHSLTYEHNVKKKTFFFLAHASFSVTELKC